MKPSSHHFVSHGRKACVHPLRYHLLHLTAENSELLRWAIPGLTCWRESLCLGVYHCTQVNININISRGVNNKHADVVLTVTGLPTWLSRCYRKTIEGE